MERYARNTVTGMSCNQVMPAGSCALRCTAGVCSNGPRHRTHQVEERTDGMM
jgi:hypothetical protein